MGDPVAFLELHEIHEYIRHSLAVYVTWFTFFLLFMFGAMAWSLRASIDKRGYVSTVAPFLFVLGLFALQLVFGIWLTNNIRADVLTLDRRALAILHGLAELKKEPETYHPTSPVPQALHFAFELMEWVLISQLAFWSTVGVYICRHRGKKLVSPMAND